MKRDNRSATLRIWDCSLYQHSSSSPLMIASIRKNLGAQMQHRYFSLFIVVIDERLRTRAAFWHQTLISLSMSVCLVARTLLHCQTKPGLTALGFPEAPCWSVDLKTVFYWPVGPRITHLTVWARTSLARALWRQVSVCVCVKYSRVVQVRVQNVLSAGHVPLLWLVVSA